MNIFGESNEYDVCIQFYERLVNIRLNCCRADLHAADFWLKPNLY